MPNTAVDGANALKVDHEITNDTTLEYSSSQAFEELPLQTQEEESNALVLENEHKEEEQVSNGLENFEIEEETPELFNSEDNESSDNEFTSFDNSKNSEEEDDLEIPAFLRRQKNQ